jgi:hypothetical protein
MLALPAGGFALLAIVLFAAHLRRARTKNP